jgi:hypothetical protein
MRFVEIAEALRVLPGGRRVVLMASLIAIGAGTSGGFIERYWTGTASATGTTGTAPTPSSPIARTSTPVNSESCAATSAEPSLIATSSSGRPSGHALRLVF